MRLASASGASSSATTATEPWWLRGGDLGVADRDGAGLGEEAGGGAACGGVAVAGEAEVSVSSRAGRVRLPQNSAQAGVMKS